jgi:hypothetical protein
MYSSSLAASLKKKMSDIKFVYTSKKDLLNKPEGDKIFRRVKQEEQHVADSLAYRKATEAYIAGLEKELMELHKKHEELKKTARFFHESYMASIQDSISQTEFSLRMMTKRKNETGD